MRVLTDTRAEPPIALPHRASRGYWGSVFQRVLRDPVAMVAGLVILAIVLAAIFAPWVAPGDPYKGSMIRRLKPIGDAFYLLGSDELGRDMVTRLIYGGPPSPFLGRVPGGLPLPIRPTPAPPFLL